MTIKLEIEILRHLKDNGSITPHEALMKYSCFRLASVIHRLRESQWPIETELVQQEDNKRARYARYHLSMDQDTWPS